MDNYSIKSVTFGGFDKQDVVRYIEQAAQQAETVQKALGEERDSLQEQLSALNEEVSFLQSQVDALTKERDSLQAALQQESAARRELETLKSLEEANAALEKENAALRPDAQAYAQFRERLGSIECEARKRASDIELATVARLQQMMEVFVEQYLSLTATFEATANHVNGELQKVEAMVTQLPRAMEQSGVELNDLSIRLEQLKESLY